MLEARKKQFKKRPKSQQLVLRSALRKAAKKQEYLEARKAGKQIETKQRGRR